MLEVSQKMLQAAKEAAEDINENTLWVDIPGYPGIIVAQEDDENSICFAKFESQGRTFFLCQKVES